MRQYRFLGAVATLALAAQIGWADGVPRSARLVKDAGNQFLAAKSYSDAIDCYFQALQLYPSYSEAHYNLGVAFLKGYNEIRLTIHHLDQYLKLAPNAPDRQSVDALLVALRERLDSVPEVRGQVLRVIGGRLLVSGGNWVKPGDRIEVAKRGEDPCACLLADYVYPDCLLTQRIWDAQTLELMKPGFVAVNSSERILPR